MRGRSFVNPPLAGFLRMTGARKRPFYPTGHPDERSEEGPPSIKLQNIRMEHHIIEMTAIFTTKCLTVKIFGISL